MPAPIAEAVRVPLYPPRDAGTDGSDSDSDGDGAAAAMVLPVTYIYLQLVSFSGRFFWLHISESPSATAERPPPSKFGACSVAIPSSLGGAAVATALLDLSAPTPQQLEGGAVPSGTQAVAFARGLSERLVRRIEKDCGAEAAVYAACALDGDRALMLLGTDGGSTFPATVAFGATVFREALTLIKRHIPAERSAQGTFYTFGYI